MADLIPGHMEVMLTEWPNTGPPKVITRPWNIPFTRGYVSYDFPLIDNAAELIRLTLENIEPADPGWIAATAQLSGTYGQPLGNRRPVRFYGRISDTGSHLYFPSNGYDPAYSVELRVVNGGITDE